MKNKIGVFCMVLGALLMTGAVALALRNQNESDTAKESVEVIVPQLVQQIRVQTEAQGEKWEEEFLPELQIPVELLTQEEKKMKEVEIDGHLYIGYISFPTLNMELPVMSTWSYSKLKIAPCRYSGSLRGEDLVVMAHSYRSHFGILSKLEMGAEVLFTDVDGKITRYTVVGRDILDDSAVEVMTAGEYDLSLFTCTYGGSSRYTVYCDLA